MSHPVLVYNTYVLVNWIYKSRVALLEQINVLRHQVFVILNSHKRSLFLCDLVIHFIDVRFLFPYAVRLGLRGCHSNVRLGRSRSARLITKSVNTGVSEWVTHLHIGVPITNFVSTPSVTTRLKMMELSRFSRRSRRRAFWFRHGRHSCLKEWETRTNTTLLTF